MNLSGEWFNHGHELERYRRFLREAEVERLVREIRWAQRGAQQTEDHPAGLLQRLIRRWATS